ncbi:MAG: MBL fold metallo-hydrolase [Patescibacteria group bacterium]
MIITWLGHSCFKIQTTNATILTDPYDNGIGIRLPKVTADLVLVSHDHSDHSNIAGVSGTPYVASSPGEYEVRGVFAQGLSAFHDNTNGSECGATTIFRIEAEDMKLVHLGDLGQAKLTDEQFEHCNGADILFIPVGGHYTIDAKTAVDIITQLEPRIVIPMHYKIPGLDAKKFPIDGVDTFIKHMGVASNGHEDKLKIVKKDLPQEETKVIILKPAA